MNEHLGTLDTVDGRLLLRFERRLAHPPEKVWKAVTDPAEMAHWFPANIETDLRIGAPMRFSFGDDTIDAGGKYTEGEVLELDPPKVYAFRWADDVFRFEIVPDSPGCRLLFSQTLSDTGTHNDRPAAARQAPGWDACLASLETRLNGQGAPQLDGSWFLDRAETYIEKFGLAEGEVRETGDGYVVRFERDLVQPVDEVWGTLVEDDKPVTGETPPLRFTHGYLSPSTVTAVEPPHVLEYAWEHDGTPAGRVRFELNHQEPLGCRLLLTQTLPVDFPQFLPTALAAWQTHLEVLFATLGGSERCWPDERTDVLTRMYADRLNAAGR